MFLAKYKHILLALLLLAFTSQSIAFEFMSCQLGTQAPVTSPHSSTDSSMSMDMNAHMDHSMSLTDQPADDAQTEKSDCCNSGCECASNACASIALFSATSDSFIHSSHNYIGLENSHISSRILASLYKPPISR